MSRPKFVMFKMGGCAGCDQFFENGWQVLTSDPQFTNAFECFVYYFDKKNPFNFSKFGNMVREVPFFAIKFSNGNWKGLGTFKENRSPQYIKQKTFQALR